MLTRNKIVFTRGEARLVEQAVCELMDGIRHDIKRGKPPLNYLETFASCRAILRKLDGIEAP
jgi:hypothetical protein